MVMKRISASLVLTALLCSMFVPTVAQASESAFSIEVPAVGNIYTDTVGLTAPREYSLRKFYLSAPAKRMGTQYKYGGGKSMVFQGALVSSHYTWDPEVVVAPGGSSASTRFICDMYPGTMADYIAVRMNSAAGVIVTVLAQGDWVYNY